MRIELEKFSKKLLTNSGKRDRIAKLNSIARDLKRRVPNEMKKISKKCLTNGDERVRIANVPLMRRVPCKLNNVTKRKHQTELLVVRNHDGRTKVVGE